MIDWVGLLTNSMWIFASALAMAVVSVAYWKAQHSGEKMRELLKMPEHAFLLNLSGFFFCVGMAAISKTWWEITIWVVLLFFFGFQSWMSYQDRNRKMDARDDQDDD